MKLKYLVLMVLITIVLTSCGSGGGSDTMGTLTLTTPAVAGGTNVGEYASVTYTVTYTPPAGKVPNGVIIKHSVLNSLGVVVLGPTDIQLTSSNSVITGFTAVASSAEQLYTIVVSIGTMQSGTSVIVKAGATVVP